MPSSHAQAAGFLVAWGVGYVLSSTRRYGIGEGKVEGQLEVVRTWRTRIYVFGLMLWSVLVSYSRQVIVLYSLS